jgi:hypothetical protein
MEKHPISVVLYSIDFHTRYISFPDVSASSEITVTNDISLNPLVNGEYLQITTDENEALHTVGYIRMSIFTDGSGNTYATDSSGNPITSRLVTNTIYTYPYSDASLNNIDGYLTVYFDDGTYFGNNDTNDAAYWYSIDGLPLVYKQFT